MICWKRTAGAPAGILCVPATRDFRQSGAAAACRRRMPAGRLCDRRRCACRRRRRVSKLRRFGRLCLQLWAPSVPFWTTRGGSVAKSFPDWRKVCSMNVFNELVQVSRRQQVCRIGLANGNGVEFWQSGQVDGHFKNPVASKASNDHLRRSLIEGGIALRSTPEGLKPAQGFDCALLQNRDGVRGVLGGL